MKWKRQSTSVVYFFFTTQFYKTERDKHKKRESSPSLSASLPPSPPPVLFWPDSMAPGRQWHDHRNRGQKGHSSLVNLEMSLAILLCSLLKTALVHVSFPLQRTIALLFNLWEISLTQAWSLYQCPADTASLSWNFTSYAQIVKHEQILVMWWSVFAFS